MDMKRMSIIFNSPERRHFKCIACDKRFDLTIHDKCPHCGKSYPFYSKEEWDVLSQDESNP